LRYINTFKFGDAEIEILKRTMPHIQDPKFFDWLRTLNCDKVVVSAVPEGTVVFGREPLMRIEGPLAVCQLFETTLLTLINYASLMATNAARFRLAAGPEKVLIEFGLRRA